MSQVLIVEDQPGVARALEVLFEVHDIPCLHAREPAEALRHVATGKIGLVLQDMNFHTSATSGEEGIALFRRIRELDAEMPVLLMTAWTSLETAVQLVKEGANDYFSKPWDDSKLLTSVRTLLRMRALQAENERLKAAREESKTALAKKFDLCGLVYESEAMQRVVSLAVQIAASDVPVLITGPNGSGKEKIAEIVQANSRRRGKPFVRVNVGALPNELLESELFGAEPGAFTGATKLRIGRFEAADGGTLFLDEIGNLSPAGQMKLLRVLQGGDFERLGSNQTRRVDVRLLCATNADLKAAIAAGTFREDLFFRLNVIELAVPALKERPEDILPLARSFLLGLSSPPGAPSAAMKKLGPVAERALCAHDWPGNVRELLNRIQRANIVSAGDGLTPADLGFSATSPERSGKPGVDEDERAALENLLVRHGGSVSHAADELNLSRQALYRRMERLGITLERRPKD
ncbi:MAG: sigma-54 dependent transcriptional regulator [Thermoanaerobaculia bacterium]